MSTMSDPRVFFAAERTLLAWIRTGLTVMGLGFVVARFGLFLALLSAGPARAVASGHGPSSVLGILLVLVGAGAILGAAANYRHFLRSLPAMDRPPAALRSLTLLVAGMVAAIGLVLAAYLAVS